MAVDPFLTFSTDAINPPETISAQTVCRKVTIVETDATQDYQVRKLSTSSNAIKRLAGTPFTFNAPAGTVFIAGQTVGFVETLAGSITMQQIEEF